MLGHVLNVVVKVELSDELCQAATAVQIRVVAESERLEQEGTRAGTRKFSTPHPATCTTMIVH